MSPFLSFTKQKVNKIKHILLNISSEESVQLRVWPSVTNFLNIVKTILPCRQPNIFGMKLKLWSNLSHHWRISVSKKAFKNSWSKEITQSLCTHVFWYLPVTYVIMSVTLMILMAMTLMILTTGGGCRPRVEIIIGRAGGEQERERERARVCLLLPFLPSNSYTPNDKGERTYTSSQIEILLHPPNKIEIIRPIQIDVQICW